MSACVLVFGDLGHSPRMQNHALSMASCDEVDRVYFVGYQGSDLPLAIQQNDKIEVRYISTSLIDKLKKLPRIFYLVYFLLRIIIQLLQSFWVLFTLPNIRFWIYQNPPCIPGLWCLAVVRLFRRRSRIILDWHNYGYSILRVNGVNRLIVKVAKIYEKLCGRWADYNLCVSNNFKDDLQEDMGIIRPIHVLYDKATPKYGRLDISERHELFTKLWQDDNKFTVESLDGIQEKPQRDLILFSSTSYTPDEDFNLVVQALISLNEKIINEKGEDYDGPGIHLVVTGKGPLKEQFEVEFEECNKNLKHVQIETMWLEIEDYPKLVGSADLGVCLHYSSSGVDLPMKVVDMFSAQLGCLAINYQSISELVKDDENGQIFIDKDQLCEQIYSILNEFKDGKSPTLEKWREDLKNGFCTERWEDHWNRFVYTGIIQQEL
ncbi:unnamed protein product [Moneuplotes crassus]|uniref:Beta-1,4-mannosyltransferase n=1 Tax=Euplotes crassus TaxID=5936 RepID=A0AAD1UJE5_EUPCR|nr:unnamed protein product [Moneuplotes crassus]